MSYSTTRTQMYPPIEQVAPLARATEEYYLSFVNNYLSVACIAEHHGISETFAIAVIREGRRLHCERHVPVTQERKVT